LINTDATSGLYRSPCSTFENLELPCLPEFSIRCIEIFKLNEKYELAGWEEDAMKNQKSILEDRETMNFLEAAGKTMHSLQLDQTTSTDDNTKPPLPG
jgi:transcriptional antiterminator Rof (Rho-off)